MEEKMALLILIVIAIILVRNYGSLEFDVDNCVVKRCTVKFFCALFTLHSKAKQNINQLRNIESR